MGLGRTNSRDASAYQDYVADLRRSLSPEFTLKIAPPFVVVGDGSEERVEADARDVVGWAAARLKADFFPREPRDIVAIYVFDTEDSYYRNANALFGHTPATPYGYYAPCDDVIVVNGSLGNGTLVHELVHVLIEANFPDAPIWYDEGLASLFEQPTEVRGHIRGDTNWRLAGLQARLETGWVPSFATLFAMSRSSFYAESSKDSNYAVARYLLYYLQERGLLIRFHNLFVKNQRWDPGGEQTLKRILAVREWESFERTWSRYVLTLSRSQPGRS